MKYFLLKSTIFFCVKQKISGSSEMKLLRYHFANISNLPNINCALSFISFLFFTEKDWILADSLLLNSSTIFVFLRLRESTIFSSINLFFFYFLIFLIRINAVQLFINLSFKLFFSGLVRWFVLIEWKCFRLKCFNYF